MSKIEFSVIVKLILSKDPIDTRLGIGLVNQSKFSTIDRFFIYKQVKENHSVFSFNFKGGFLGFQVKQ